MKQLITFCQTDLTMNLGIKFLRLLTNDLKVHCVSVCTEVNQVQDAPIFIINIITSDEAWIYSYGPETTQRLLEKLPNSQ